MSYCNLCKKQKANNDHSFFHKFPNDDARRNRWLQSINQPNWMPSPTDRLCSDHFVEECFEFKPNIKATTRLKKDSIPTIFGGRMVNYNIGSENCISNPRKKIKSSDDTTTTELLVGRTPLKEITGTLAINTQKPNYSQETAVTKFHLQATSPATHTDQVNSSSATQGLPNQPIHLQLTLPDLNQMFRGINNDHTYGASLSSINLKKTKELVRKNKLANQKKFFIVFLFLWGEAASIYFLVVGCR